MKWVRVRGGIVKRGMEYYQYCHLSVQYNLVQQFFFREVLVCFLSSKHANVA